MSLSSRWVMTRTEGSGVATEMVSHSYEGLESDAQVVVDSARGLPLDQLPKEAYRNLLVVTTTQAPKKVEEAVRAGGGDPADVGVVPVSGSTMNYDGPLWTADRVDPSDLTGLSMRFAQASKYLQPGNGWVVFDNLTVMLMYAPEQRVYRLLASVTSNLREREIRGLYGVVRSAMDDGTYNRLLGLFDEELDG